LNDIQPSNVVDWTPLGETLYESMLYFMGRQSYYNPGTSYTSPIQYRCQKSYVLIITDGAPTHDVADDPTSPIKIQVGSNPRIGDYDSDERESGSYGDPLLQGSHYLDDIAKYMHENDMSSTLTGRQNITVYTIGFNPSEFAIDSTLLQSTADKGGGKYFYCHNAQSFKLALQKIIEEILSQSTSFVAPTVPISQMEKETSGDRIYLGMFRPKEKSFWSGNIKKLGIVTSNDPVRGLTIGEVIDKNGNLAIDPETNAIYDTAVSYWSTTADGGEVEKGGVGEILRNSDLSQRKIYTYLGTNTDLTHSSNAFTTSNISAPLLGLTTEDEKDKLINFLYGYDAYDEDQDSNTTETRQWILGSFIHSRPLVIHYSSKTVIFAGANDGMLHAFNDANGTELWAFIPPDLLSKLNNLTGEAIEFFVDGSPKAYIERDAAGNITKAILICGERRGGDHYFALDITNPDVPKWLWKIHPGLSDYSEMGQTWSSPLIGKIKYGTTEKWVFFIGGGYDLNQDSFPVPQNSYDSKGRAIYVVDVLSGARIWKYSVSNNSLMKYSIPSDISIVDINGDGRIDRLYVGDMGGQIWRFDVGDASAANWTGKRIFNSQSLSPPSGTDLRKIFYPPDVTLEKEGGYYELIVFGTGDREHPKGTGVIDRLYAIKDRNPENTLTESNLVDVTTNLLQSGSQDEKSIIYNQLRNESGWYIQLNQSYGEKCLFSPLVIYGISYFTTFTPSEGVATDPCFLGEGTARVYAINYLNGNAEFNFDLTNDANRITLGRSDRATVIGTAIPSGAIISVIGGSTAVGYVGIGGGIYRIPLKKTKVLIPVYWRQIF
jgi:type IV pilus assembly protein PilY1